MGNGGPSDTPDFAALFPACTCGQESCDSCSIFQVTPRVAAALWTAARMLADMAHDDIKQHGGRPVTDDGRWSVFAQYPMFTWTQDAAWRSHAARAFDDLADDLATGKEPQRTCPADEMALYMMLQYGEAAVADSWPGLAELLDALPAHPQDLDWDKAEEQLLIDTDLIFMWDMSLDGIESPEAETNQLAGIGDFRPAAWFTPFEDAEPRDPDRPLRR